MIAAIMPCRGRAEQTIANVKRLLAMAGRVEWQLICVIDDDVDIQITLQTAELPIKTMTVELQSGYWKCLKFATDYLSDFPLIVNLANDLLPGRDWLERGVASYRARFGDGEGLMGFNDGLHGPELSPHFLISRKLLDRYGGWPCHYRHNYGDTELNLRAQQEGLYGKSAWSVLYHNHPFLGAEGDSVYDEGLATFDQDRTLFQQRRAAGWV